MGDGGGYWLFYLFVYLWECISCFCHHYFFSFHLTFLLFCLFFVRCSDVLWFYWVRGSCSFVYIYEFISCFCHYYLVIFLSFSFPFFYLVFFLIFHAVPLCVVVLLEGFTCLFIIKVYFMFFVTIISLFSLHFPYLFYLHFFFHAAASYVVIKGNIIE